MARAMFGDVGLSLFVAGAAFPDSSPKRRVRDDDFMVGSWSRHGRIIVASSFFRRKQFKDFPLKC